MSEENVEIVRLILAAWAQGDFRKEAERLDPQIVFETFMPDTEGNVVARGVEDLAAYTRDWFAQWRRYRIVGEDFEAVGPDKVFASVRQIGAGGQSGVEVESPGFTVWTLREGKVVGLFLHYDRSEALNAAGLRE